MDANRAGARRKNEGGNVMEQQAHWNKEHAESYSRSMRLLSRVFYSRFARMILKRLPAIDKRATIVDLGCGPGFLSIELGRLLPSARIIGVDPSANMLEVAKRNADEAGVANYETRLGGAEHLPLGSNSVDLVVTQGSLHEWDHVEQGFAEILRVLRPRGSLMVKDFNRNWLSPWKRALVEPFHHLKMFRYSFDDVVTYLDSAGFGGFEGDRTGLQFLIQATKPSERGHKYVGSR
jgi:ubiquinone/menaquinone biosynthesis C-methylase UbiE